MRALRGPDLASQHDAAIPATVFRTATVARSVFVPVWPTVGGLRDGRTEAGRQNSTSSASHRNRTYGAAGRKAAATRSTTSPANTSASDS